MLAPLEEEEEAQWLADQQRAQEVAEQPDRALGRRPRDAPTPEQRRLHEELHEPFRVWCRASVAGRAKAFLALTREQQDKEVLVIGIDYGCF